MGTALVSVAMPCFNAANTLPFALSSLLAQTYEHWECILVDDGSTDHTKEFVDQANDPRIRYIRLPENRGRGVARQVALDHAQGEYLCMLDADDWMYPSRIESQVRIMQQDRRLALVSAGMAIVGRDGELVGVRGRGPLGSNLAVQGPWRSLGVVPPHAPSMIRMNVAKLVRYDPRLILSEDRDFLLQVLMGRHYVVMPDVAYVYAEPASVTPEKILQSLEYSRQIYGKYRSHYPIASRIRIGQALVKQLMYRAAFALGQKDRLIHRRASTPSIQESRNFNAARSVVLTRGKQTFGMDSDKND